MPTEFRKHADRWHWCPECPKWPDRDFTSTVLSVGTPEGEHCLHCRELDLKFTCTRQS